MDAHDWDERYAASELVWSSTPNQFVAAELAELTPGRAVDVAAGEGRNSLWLADQGWDVTAVDYSLVGLDKGRALQARHPHGRDLRVEWVHADVTAYEPGEGLFDLAVIAYLQLPADQRRAAVRNAFRTLVEGGTLLVVAHDSTNLAEGTGGPQDPAFLYTAEDVLGDLDGFDLTVDKAGRVSRDVDGRIAYDALVRLRRGALS